MQVEQFTAFVTLGMKVCEMGDSLCMEVGKFDLSTKRRKKAVKIPRRRNLRLRIGWDLGLIFFSWSVLNCFKMNYKKLGFAGFGLGNGGKDRKYGALG